MLCMLPRQVPALAVMLDDIGNPSAAQLGRAFGVTARTAAAWRKRDAAPLPVLLALFWLTRWGQSAVNCHAVNAVQLHAGLADARARENNALRSQLAQLPHLAARPSRLLPLQAVQPAVMVPLRRRHGRQARINAPQQAHHGQQQQLRQAQQVVNAQGWPRSGVRMAATPATTLPIAAGSLVAKACAALPINAARPAQVLGSRKRLRKKLMRSFQRRESPPP